MDWHTHRNAESVEPEVFQGGSEPMAEQNASENQTNAQAPEQDHAALVG
jgi:hypothetical protein